MSLMDVHRFLGHIRHKKHYFLFGLNDTLLKKPIYKILDSDIQKNIDRETIDILSNIQSDGHSINIISRMADKSMALDYLKKGFPNIKFNNIEIYTTQIYKNKHINNLINTHEIDNDFIMMDGDRTIISNAMEEFPDAKFFYTPECVQYSTFIDKNNKYYYNYVL